MTLDPFVYITNDRAFSQTNVQSISSFYNNVYGVNIPLTNIEYNFIIDRDINIALNPIELDSILRAQNISQIESNSLKQVVFIFMVVSVIAGVSVVFGLQPTAALILVPVSA